MPPPHQPCDQAGAILDKKANEFRLYYGAADSSVGLAVADPAELIEYIKSCPSVE